MNKINPTREIKWETPEPRIDGRENRGKQHILDAVRYSPGQWAIWNESCTLAVYYQSLAKFPEYNWEYNKLPSTGTTRLVRIFVQFPLAEQGK